LQVSLVDHLSNSMDMLTVGATKATTALGPVWTMSVPENSVSPDNNASGMQDPPVTGSSLVSS
jgi:hypothetical protein